VSVGDVSSRVDVDLPWDAGDLPLCVLGQQFQAQTTPGKDQLWWSGEVNMRSHSLGTKRTKQVRIWTYTWPVRNAHISFCDAKGFLLCPNE
jgi:hypothetical protein